MGYVMEAALDSKPTILIVDDMPSVLEALAALLETENAQLVMADSGQGALDKVAECPPDLILLDVMMPGMDGFATAQCLKGDARWKHIPIILVTALDSTAALVQGLEAGADEFLSKPIVGMELRARVRSMLRIKRQHDELRANLKLREDLANMIAHDMRTPLTLILNTAEDLEHATGLAPDMQAAVRLLRDQTRRLNGFLTDMLLLAKMEAGHLLLNCTVLDVNGLAQEAAQTYGPLVTARGRRLATELAPERCLANLDAKLMGRVLDNLLSNALKFSPPGGQIVLRVEATASGPKILMIDEGPGIPASHRADIFDKYRIIALKQHDVPQLGLGLAFCKLVVEAHGGQIQVAENQPTGSVFTVALPRDWAGGGQ